jgi:hypothetical protein
MAKQPTSSVVLSTASSSASSGAASVSLYVPPRARQSEILLHEGRLEPVRSWWTLGGRGRAAPAFLHSAGTTTKGRAVSQPRADGALPDPLRWVFSKAEDDAAGGTERRKRDGRSRTELTAWTGLRFDRDEAARKQDGLLYFPTAADTLSDDDTSTLTLANAAALQVVQTLTDADGDTDTASINLGAGVFQIEDDGPNAVVANATPDTLVLDETRPVGSEEDGDSAPAGLRDRPVVQTCAATITSRATAAPSSPSSS